MLNLMPSLGIEHRTYALAIIMFYLQVSFRIGYFWMMEMCNTMSDSCISINHIGKA